MFKSISCCLQMPTKRIYRNNYRMSRICFKTTQWWGGSKGRKKEYEDQIKLPCVGNC